MSLPLSGRYRNVPPKNEATARIILLNGTSSAGKTTLARKLQSILPDPWLYMALDQFRDGMAPQYRGLNAPEGSDGARGLNVVPVHPTEGTPYTEIRYGDVGHTTVLGMHRACAAVADAGNNLIIDDVICERTFLDDYIRVLPHDRTFFVGVQCQESELARREAQRPGRFLGTATGMMLSCHRHGIYDLSVDTSATNPENCARQIVRRIGKARPTAFGQLARGLTPPANRGESS